MSDHDDGAWRNQLDMVREQVWSGYLTTIGIQASRQALAFWLVRLPPELREEAEWLLEQLDAELLMRELDGADGEVSS